MASTYVQLTRDEFEDWLNTDLSYRGKWQIKDRTGGVYQVFLSDLVAIEIQSTTGNQAQVRGHGEASMSLRLISRISGQTINGKSMGVTHGNRTRNWRKNWKAIFIRVRDVYQANPSFYNKVADKKKYTAAYMGRIEAIEGWEKIPNLSEMHAKLKGGGILWDNQEDTIDNWKAVAPAPQQQPEGRSKEEKLQVLRDIYVAARRARDQWTMDFAKSIAALITNQRPLSQAQIQILEKKEDFYLSPQRRAALAFTEKYMAAAG